VLTTDNRNPDRFAEELSKAVAERGVLALLSQRPIPPYSELAIKVHSEPCCPFWDHRGTDGGHYEALGLTTGLQAAREAARALANMAAHEHLAPTVLALHRSELIELAQLEDLVVREQTARALANLASYRTPATITVGALCCVPPKLALMDGPPDRGHARARFIMVRSRGLAGGHPHRSDPELVAPIARGHNQVRVPPA
jgi:HEAT repeat protein